MIKAIIEANKAGITVKFCDYGIYQRITVSDYEKVRKAEYEISYHEAMNHFDIDGLYAKIIRQLCQHL